MNDQNTVYMKLPEEERKRIVDEVRSALIEEIQNGKPYLGRVDAEVEDFLTRRDNGVIVLSIKIYKNKFQQMVVDVIKVREQIRYDEKGREVSTSKF